MRPLFGNTVRELLRCSHAGQHGRVQGHRLLAPGDCHDVVEREVAPVNDGQSDLLGRGAVRLVHLNTPRPSGQVQWLG